MGALKGWVIGEWGGMAVIGKDIETGTVAGGHPFARLNPVYELHVQEIPTEQGIVPRRVLRPVRLLNSLQELVVVGHLVDCEKELSDDDQRALAEQCVAIAKALVRARSNLVLAPGAH